MRTQIKGAIKSWHHEPDGRGCFVKVWLNGGGEFDIKATPELTAAAKRGASVTITIEAEPEKSCPCCGSPR